MTAPSFPLITQPDLEPLGPMGRSIRFIIAGLWLHDHPEDVAAQAERDRLLAYVIEHGHA